MTIFISMVWGGGVVALWSRASRFDAVFWPFMLGEYLALTATQRMARAKRKEKGE